MPRKTRQEIQRELSALRARLPEARGALEGIPGVVDVGAGIREKGGMATDEVVIHVFVDWKKPLIQLPPEHRIPPVVAGFPTDVIQVQDIEAQGEVILGGMNATAGGSGTLGAIGLTTGANAHLPADTPVLLTNNHVASKTGGLVGVGSVCDSLCCQCCDVGTVVDSQLTNQVDGAIARLNADVRFSHEILGIGPVRGTDTAVVGTPILKYGNTTKLTSGSVTSVTFPVPSRGDGASFINQIRVAPVAPSTDMSEGGDSGSVYIDSDTRSVVGLHHAGPRGGPSAIGNHIGQVTALLDIDFPVMHTAGAIPLSGPALEAAQPTLVEGVKVLREELEQSEAGRRWLDLVRTHAREVRDLVNQDRETQVAWQRHRGPAFVAHFVKSARDADHRIPHAVGDVRIENLILAMAATLQRSGSPELVAAITEHYLTVLQFAGESETVEAFLCSARDRAASLDARLTPTRAS